MLGDHVAHGKAKCHLFVDTTTSKFMTRTRTRLPKWAQGVSIAVDNEAALMVAPASGTAVIEPR